MVEYFLVMIIVKGFDPISHSIIDGFTTHEHCEAAANDIMEANSTLNARLVTQYTCIPVRK